MKVNHINEILEQVHCTLRHLEPGANLEIEAKQRLGRTLPDNHL